MLNLETRTKDITRYHNRGVQLLREEQTRAALRKNVPKLETEIQKLVTE